jgi:hypothetical protein
MRSTLRTHTCGASGARTWLRRHPLRLGERAADQGGVAFIDLRDRHGLTQVRFLGDQDPALLEKVRTVRPSGACGPPARSSRARGCVEREHAHGRDRGRGVRARDPVESPTRRSSRSTAPRPGSTCASSTGSSTFAAPR